jgi:uncharacterized protein
MTVRVTRLDSQTSEAERVERLDFGRMSKAKRTPQGGLRVPAYLTRVGVFTYKRKDGTQQRELRPPEEVFHPDSLATLPDIPVTKLHPTEPVTTANWSTHAKGHVGEVIKADGKFIAAELALQDEEVVNDVETEKLKEISLGYTCNLDARSGVWEGESYDAVQHSIRYNHAALGPANWGRAGSEVRLRMDSDAVMIDRQDSKGPEVGTHQEKPMKKIRLDGIEYDVDSEAFAQAWEKHQKRIDAEAAELKSKLETLQGRADAADKELEKLKKEREELADPKRLDAAVSARVELVTKARSVLGEEAKLDGKTDREIMSAALEHKFKDMKCDDMSDERIAGAFDFMCRSTGSHDKDTKSKKRNDSLGTANGALDQASKGKGKDERLDSEAARQRMYDRNTKAWQQPLSTTKEKPAAAG